MFECSYKIDGIYIMAFETVEGPNVFCFSHRPIFDVTF
jgi:hypothetical protein